MVIPSINVSDFAEAERQIRLAESFLSSPDGWIHIDVSDGFFSDHKSWGNPEEFQTLNFPLKTEVHLMVEDPDTAIIPWLKVGVARVIVHVQSVKNIAELLKICEEHNVEVMLSADPTQSVDNIVSHKNAFTHFQILSVMPGESGQEPSINVEDKIKTLRERIPTATIEIDGGVLADNASAFIEAGADILVSGNYIFGGSDPSYSYKTLVESI